MLRKIILIYLKYSCRARCVPTAQQMRICNYAQPTPQGMMFRDTNLKTPHFELNKKYTSSWVLPARHKETTKKYALEYFTQSGVFPVSRNCVNTCVQKQTLQMSDIHPHWHLAKPHQLSPLRCGQLKVSRCYLIKWPPALGPCQTINRLRHSTNSIHFGNKFQKLSKRQ